MDLSRLNAWLSLIANLGVLVGIFVLVIEINQNTRAIDNEASWARVSTANDTYTLLVGNEEIGALILEHGPNRNMINEPSTPGILRYRFLLEMIARQNEARFLTRSDDLGVIRASTLRNLSTPSAVGFYKSQVELGLFTPEYSDFVTDIIREIEEN